MKFDFTNSKGDVFGGITAGIVALPLALAFGVSSGLGPSAGLYGAIFLAFFAALFGGTPTQISGPTAPMTAVSMVVVSGILALNNGDLELALPAILAVFLIAGIMQLILGLTGVGRYIKYIPYPVVSGFMTAIGVIILITQVLPAIGYYSKNDKDYIAEFTDRAQEHLLTKKLKQLQSQRPLELADYSKILSEVSQASEAEILAEAESLASANASGVLGSLRVLPRALPQINWIELLIALSTIAIIYGFRKITTAIPSTLVALIVVTGVTASLGVDYRPIQTIPEGLPIPEFGILTSLSIEQISPYIFTALTLALLGAIDSLLTSVVADNMTATKHNPNKELIGQGIGNSIAALFGGIPGAGATIRTVVNINSGGKTRLSGMVAGVFLLIVLLLLGPIASRIPAAVLAGILVVVGIGVMDYKGLKAVTYLPKDLKIGPLRFSSEVLIMGLVLILSSIWNLVYAVGIGLVIAALLFMKKMGDLSSKSYSLSQISSEDLSNAQDLSGQVYLKKLNGPLFFGNTSDFQELSKKIPASAKHVIIDLSEVPYIDQSGLYALEDALLSLRANKIDVILLGLNAQPKLMLERNLAIPKLITPDNLLDSMEDAVRQLQSLKSS